ncbi:MAG: 3-deoxy-D-manno-octulosonic acid transferase [Pseudomonadota bacterium]
MSGPKNRSLALAAYLALSSVAEPALRLWLARRAWRGKEDPSRLGERFGHASHPRPEGRLIWLHGASVGEAVSLLPLIGALRDASPASLLVTTATLTAAERLAKVLPEGVLHQFAPIDTRPALRRFLGHWRPDLAVRVESEIWPRTLIETARTGAPMALLNARLSERSLQGWQRVPGMARALLAGFAVIETQDRATRTRLQSLGLPPERVVQGANLKSAVAVPACAPEALSAAQEAIATRPVWLAASTHDGEERAVAEAAALVAETHPDALLILAPRHPERGAEVAALLAERGLSTARRSLGEGPAPDTQVWLADTLGEMGLWYRLAGAAFIGGSLVARGGHTPFEPAALGVAVVHGPHVENFVDVYAALAEAKAARAVATPAALAEAISALLADTSEARAMARRGAAVRARLTPDLAALAERLLALMDR